MNEKIDYIKKEVSLLGRIIDAPRHLLLVSEEPRSDGSPYFEINGDQIFVVSSERGLELYRKFVPSVDEAVFIIIERAVTRMALNYEINNRVDGQDFRRIYFGKKVELMGLIDKVWADRVLEDINFILSMSPYADG